MPSVMMDLSSEYQTTARPAIISVVDDLSKLIKTNKYTKIIYTGDIEQPIQQGSSIDDPAHLNPSDTVLFIKAEIILNKEALNTTAVYRPEQRLIFNDPWLGIHIKPIYASTDVTIEFTYQTQSQNEAIGWYESLYANIANMRDINLHKLSYSYTIPLPYQTLLEHLYELREANKGYGESIAEYIKAHSAPSLTVLSNLSGKQLYLAIAETQTRVVGQFGFSEGVNDRPVRDDTTGKYAITLSYKFSFENPIAMVMHYPIIVHNQMLDAKYIEWLVQEPEAPQNYSLSIGALHNFEVPTQSLYTPIKDPLLRVPEYDHFTSLTPRPYTVDVVCALCQIANQNQLLNLNELGDIALDKDILSFISESEYSYLNLPYQSPILITLYRNTQPAEGRDLYCTSDLSIKSLTVLDERLEHRVVIGITTDWTMLSNSAIERLRHYPNVFYKLLVAQNEAFSFHPELKKLSAYNIIPKPHIKRFIDQLTLLSTGYYRRSNIKTVMTTSTITHRNKT